MLGVGDKGGVQVQFDETCVKSADELWSDLGSHNAALVASLTEDPQAAKLLRLTEMDASCHRMTWPVPLAKFDLDRIRLNPRFAVVQDKPDGSVKVRPVDHMSWSAGKGRRV